MTWKDFAVGREASGKPTLVLSGRAREIAEGMGVRLVHLTITHTAEMAMAVVVMEG